jgi:hypothetical protein
MEDIGAVIMSSMPMLSFGRTMAQLVCEREIYCYGSLMGGMCIATLVWA